MRAAGAQLAFMVVIAIVTVPLLAALWLGPLAYGVLRLADGDNVVGGLITAAGGAWAVLHLRDKTLPGLMFGTIGSLMIVAGLMKDPWDEAEGESGAARDHA